MMRWTLAIGMLVLASLTTMACNDAYGGNDANPRGVLGPRLRKRKDAGGAADANANANASNADAGADDAQLDAIDETTDEADAGNAEADNADAGNADAGNADAGNATRAQRI